MGICKFGNCFIVILFHQYAWYSHHSFCCSLGRNDGLFANYHIKKESTMSMTRTITNDFLHYLQHRQLNELINLFANDVKWEVPGDVDHIRWLGTRNSKLEIQDLFNTLFFSRSARWRFTRRTLLFLFLTKSPKVNKFESIHL